jgi:Cu/Ag efflux pump CusA
VVSATPQGDPRRYAKKARAYVEGHVTLPPGVFLTFETPAAGAGAGAASLLVMGAIALLAMVGLLTVVLKDGRLAWLVLLSTAFSFVGGVVAVVLMGGAVSLGELAGFLALFGLASRASVLLVTRPHELHSHKGRHGGEHGGEHRERRWTLNAVAASAGHRAAAILGATILVALAVAPLLFTRAQAGGEVLGPMAAVIIGGLASGAVLGLLFLPPLIYSCGRPRPTRSR